MKLNGITDKLLSQLTELKSKPLRIESISSKKTPPPLNVITRQLNRQLQPSILDAPETRMKKEYIKDIWNSFVLLTKASQSKDELTKNGHLSEDDSYIEHMILSDVEKSQLQARDKKLRRSLNVLRNPEPPENHIHDVLQGLNINLKNM